MKTRSETWFIFNPKSNFFCLNQVWRYFKTTDSIRVHNLLANSQSQLDNCIIKLANTCYSRDLTALLFVCTFRNSDGSGCGNTPSESLNKQIPKAERFANRIVSGPIG